VFFDNLSLWFNDANLAKENVSKFWLTQDSITSPLGEFGLNFDIIETNILNLAVVIAVVIYLGGDVLTSLLNDRKQRILGTLKSADERFLEAQQKLEEAKQKVQIAQAKAVEIREQGNKTAIQAAKTLFERTEEEIRRLEESKQATLRFEEEKAMSQVRQQVVNLSIERAFTQLRAKMDASLQRKLIDTNINLLGKL
jgi:F-type H+-transporting ATPase subunit b